MSRSALLLDTNVLIWTHLDVKVSARARRAIAYPAASVAVSVVSVWELMMKQQVGKLRLQSGLEKTIDHILYRSGWTILPVRAEHLPVLARLPMLHRDPFDRLLIAQAQHENMTIVTADRQIMEYDVSTLW